MSDYGPGPQERKRSSQLFFKVFRHWPQSVVNERLAVSDARMIQARVDGLRAAHEVMRRMER